MMYSQEAISRNLSSTIISIGSNNSMLFPGTTNYKHGLDGELMKSKDMMSSDLFHQQQLSSGGLARYRSAPSTFFANFLDGLNANGTNSDSSQGEEEAENMFSALMGCSNNGSSSNNLEVRDLGELQQFSPNLKQERMEYGQQSNGYSCENSSQLVYGTAINHGNGNGSYGAAARIEQNQMQERMSSSGNCSNNLLRQSSSPAGFFAEFDVMRELGSFGTSNSTHGDSNATSCGLNNNMNYTSLPSTSSLFMPSIPENVSENIGAGSSNDGRLRNSTDPNGRSFAPSFTNGSWNDSTSSSLKRNRDGDMKMFSTFSGLENQNGESRNTTPGLTHHLSLPKTSGEMAVIEKYLDFQPENVIPCKIRAKRGFATHPRSIAERMRRTRISERMKKLQELFPNMDKQANTADMLDLAVEYIKDLQKEVQTLTDVKAKCTCPSRKSPAS